MFGGSDVGGLTLRQLNLLIKKRSSPLFAANSMIATAQLIKDTCLQPETNISTGLTTKISFTSSCSNHEVMPPGRRNATGPAPKPLTTDRQNMIVAIKSSWNLEEIGQIFSECGKREKELLYQEDGKTNDDYFEDATLSLMQQLASMTSDRADLVRQRLKSRW